jgi:TRAP transporter TAXI family solute receptor
MPAHLRRRLATIILGAALALGAGSDARADPFRLDISTGGVTGIYYQIGAAICRLLQDHPPERPITCTTAGSAGSVGNLIQMRTGSVPLALAQSDSLHDAVTGTGGFANIGRDGQVRALFTLVTETLLVLARSDAWVPKLLELKGRRVNIGAPASGSEVTFRQLLAARGFAPTEFARLSDIKASLQAVALCDGQVDAIAFMAANPVPVMQEATYLCDSRFVPLDQDFASAMIERYPYYVPAVIPGGLYANNPDPTPTIGVRATLVAPASTPEDVIYEVTRTVLDNLAELRTLHLAFAGIDAKDILSHCVFAPIHPGARRYYEERRLNLEVCPQVR